MAIEQMGLYFEEFQIGEMYKSNGRTVTEADVVNFAGLSGDFNTIHLDDAYSKTQPFGRRIAHGALGVAIETGLNYQMGLFVGTTVAFIELTATFKKPIFIGDTVHLEITPTEAIPSKKPDRGVIKFDAHLVNQDGELVTDGKWVIMMKRKPQDQ